MYEDAIKALCSNVVEEIAVFVNKTQRLEMPAALVESAKQIPWKERNGAERQNLLEKQRALYDVSQQLRRVVENTSPDERLATCALVMADSWGRFHSNDGLRARVEELATTVCNLRKLSSDDADRDVLDQGRRAWLGPDTESERLRDDFNTATRRDRRELSARGRRALWMLQDVSAQGNYFHHHRSERATNSARAIVAMFSMADAASLADRSDSAVFQQLRDVVVAVLSQNGAEPVDLGRDRAKALNVNAPVRRRRPAWLNVQACMVEEGQKRGIEVEFAEEMKAPGGALIPYVGVRVEGEELFRAVIAKRDPELAILYVWAGYSFDAPHGVRTSTDNGLPIQLRSLSTRIEVSFEHRSALTTIADWLLAQRSPSPNEVSRNDVPTHERRPPATRPVPNWYRESSPIHNKLCEAIVSEAQARGVEIELKRNGRQKGLWAGIYTEVTVRGQDKKPRANIDSNDEAVGLDGKVNMWAGLGEFPEGTVVDGANTGRMNRSIRVEDEPPALRSFAQWLLSRPGRSGR